MRVMILARLYIMGSFPACAANTSCVANSSLDEDIALLHLKAQHAAPSVQCTFSSDMCAGNQCCPGTKETGYKTYSCPSACVSFTGCEISGAHQQTNMNSGSVSSADEYDNAMVYFDNDYEDCGATMMLGAGSVQYASAGAAVGGRVVSTAGYKNLKTISFDVNFTGLSDSPQWALFKNAAIYLVSNPEGSQPAGDNYCDQGGNNCAMDCIEIDLLESNGPIQFQTTIHSGGDTSCGGSQLYEFWYPPLLWDNLSEIGCTETTSPISDDACISALPSWDPLTALATVQATFGDSEMTMSVTVNGETFVVYNSSSAGCSGSSAINYTRVQEYNSKYGYYVVSSWETSNSYIPNGQSWSGNVAYTTSCTGCDWLCDCGTSGWGFSNMQVWYMEE
eukprot:TRINITY_DN78778_c0_g1_i1.p1 TRINITY_DN78778_c0_g1~~TRINITY_DN78778_c0_g1_i1.p1  ORF type:complete len:392 (-),score=52.25 TRINITY_DN78778_c0_g1_i1:20-1195(-)